MLKTLPFDMRRVRIMAPYSENLPSSLTNSTGMEFVLIPPGEFMMGAPDDDPDAQENEKPQHKVVITRPFYLGKYPVTQGQWLAVMGRKPQQIETVESYGRRAIPGQGSEHPVFSVSWDETQEFIRRIDALNPHLRHSLPTEAQWEYACRAGTTTRRFCGDDETELHKYAWYIRSFMDEELQDYYDNIYKKGVQELEASYKNYLKTGRWDSSHSSIKNFEARELFHRLGANKNIAFTPQPVGQKLPNPWGLYDMLGNVNEWVSDVFEYAPLNSYYARCMNSEFLQRDPTGPDPTIYHAVHGGCYSDEANKIRASARDGSGGTVGFRLACATTDTAEP